MLKIEPMNTHMGAIVHGLDLSKPLTQPLIGAILEAMGKYQLLRFPDQKLDPAQHRDFATHFGHPPAIRGRLAIFTAPGVPEINILSNILVDGKPTGATDAGVIWHTDMVHNETPGFANALYALKVPRRDGKRLGGTEFYNLIAAYESLSPDMKAKLADVVGIYTGENYTSVERTPFPEYGTNSHKAHKKQPVRHKLVMTHPISGRKALYCDPGHVDYLEGVPAVERDSLLRAVLDHIMQPQHHFVYDWTEGDLMMWDNLSTVHHAVLDFGPDEHRLIWRCQIEGDKAFDPAFVSQALQAAKAA